MATSVIEPTLYKPEWNAEIEKYEDINPLEKNSRHHWYRCNCRYEKGDIIKTHSEFKSHFERDYHKNWRRRFGALATKELLELRHENEDLKKENAKMAVQFEKDLLKLKRDTRILKEENHKLITQITPTEKKNETNFL